MAQKTKKVVGVEITSGFWGLVRVEGERAFFVNDRGQSWACEARRALDLLTTRRVAVYSGADNRRREIASALSAPPPELHGQRILNQIHHTGGAL